MFYKLVTNKSSGYILAIDFAVEIVDYLLGKEKTIELKRDIIYTKN